MAAILLLAGLLFGCGGNGSPAQNSQLGEQVDPGQGSGVGGGGGGGGGDSGGGGGGGILTGWNVLSWDPYTDPKGVRINVYVSQAPGVYAGPYKSVASNVTETTVAGLELGRQHYFSVTASDASGNESARSNEVSGYPNP
jgi:hypothetical protein